MFHTYKRQSLQTFSPVTWNMLKPKKWKGTSMCCSKSIPNKHSFFMKPGMIRPAGQDPTQNNIRCRAAHRGARGWARKFFTRHEKTKCKTSLHWRVVSHHLVTWLHHVWSAPYLAVHINFIMPHTRNYATVPSTLFFVLVKIHSQQTLFLLSRSCLGASWSRAEHPSVSQTGLKSSLQAMPWKTCRNKKLHKQLN